MVWEKIERPPHTPKKRECGGGGSGGIKMLGERVEEAAMYEADDDEVRGAEEGLE